MTTTDRTRHVLDAIDGALEDRTVSGDAMRWTPGPEVPFGLEHRRPIGFRGGRVPPPRQQGRGLLAFGSGRAYHLVDRDDPAAVWQGAVLADVFGVAFREAAEAMARLMNAAEEAAQPLAALLEQLADVDEPPAEAIAEDARARALRLRRERNTGPSRDLTRQRRPRQLP